MAGNIGGLALLGVAALLRHTVGHGRGRWWLYMAVLFLAVWNMSGAAGSSTVLRFAFIGSALGCLAIEIILWESARSKLIFPNQFGLCTVLTLTLAIPTLATWVQQSGGTLDTDFCTAALFALGCMLLCASEKERAAPQQIDGSRVARPTHAEQYMGALPLLGIFVLTPLLVKIAGIFMKKFQMMEIGDLPVITAMMLTAAHGAAGAPLVVLAWFAVLVWIYSKWIAPSSGRILVFRWTSIVAIAFLLLFFTLAMALPIFPSSGGRLGR